MCKNIYFAASYFFITFAILNFIKILNYLVIFKTQGHQRKQHGTSEVTSSLHLYGNDLGQLQ